MSLKEVLKVIVPNKELRLKINKILTCRLSDEFVIELLYKLATGKELDLKNPKTLNEKIQWYKLYYHNDLMTQCADKYAVRAYVKSCGLEHILVKNYGVYNNVNEIPFNNLPEKCILKCTHNSNGNAIWNERKKERIKKNLNRMLKNNAYYSSREWSYKNISPRITIDELLEPQNNSGLIDFNFFCFDGVPKMVLYNEGLSDKNGGHADGRRSVFNEKFEELNIETALQSLPKGSVEKPNNYEEMFEYAKILSEPFPFVRVDFFYADGEIKFGELTFYTAGGYGKYKPDKWNYIMGDWFKLPCLH